MAKQTVQEFERQYAKRSGVTVAWLHEHGRYGARCDCGDRDCEGFQMAHVCCGERVISRTRTREKDRLNLAGPQP